MNRNTELLVFGGLGLIFLILGIIIFLELLGLLHLSWFLVCLSVLLYIGVAICIGLKLWVQHILIRQYEEELNRLRRCERNLHWANKDLEALKREVEKVLKQW